MISSHLRAAAALLGTIVLSVNLAGSPALADSDDLELMIFVATVLEGTNGAPPEATLAFQQSGMMGAKTMTLPGVQNLKMPDMDPMVGRKLFANKGCVACHSINGALTWARASTNRRGSTKPKANTPRPSRSTNAR